MRPASLECLPTIKYYNAYTYLCICVYMNDRLIKTNYFTTTLIKQIQEYYCIINKNNFFQNFLMWILYYTTRFAMKVQLLYNSE